MKEFYKTAGFVQVCLHFNTDVARLFWWTSAVILLAFLFGKTNVKLNGNSPSVSAFHVL